MTNFILTSIVASVLLTLLLNLLPLLFPRAAARAQRKLEEHSRRMAEQHEGEDQPRVTFFFPWKVMLLVSIVLTILVNVIGFLSRGQ